MDAYKKRKRAGRYVNVLQFDHAFHPVAARGEERWFVGYGVAAFVYRLLILFGIALFVSQKFFVIGAALALFAVGVRVVVPLIRRVVFLLTSPRLGEKRVRAVAISAGLALGVAGFLFLFPVPSLTSAEGVVWPPEGAEVRARAEGVVLRLLVEPNAVVEPGDPLVLTRDASLEARVAVLQAQLRELRARHHAERMTDRVKAQITSEEITTVTAELAPAEAPVPAVGAFGGAAASSSSNASTSTALLGRAVRSRARQANTSLSQRGSRPGTEARGEGGSCVSRLTAADKGVSPWNGRSPVSSSYRTIPSE